MMIKWRYNENNVAFIGGVMVVMVGQIEGSACMVWDLLF